MILVKYQEPSTKVSSLVVPPSMSHAGARRRRQHPPLSTPQWSLSPAAAPSSSTPHAGLVASGHVLHRHVPRRTKSPAAASSVVNAPHRSLSPAAASSVVTPHAVTPHAGGHVLRRQRLTAELVASSRVLRCHAGTRHPRHFISSPVICSRTEQ